MMRTMFKSKIHRATVTEANLNYAGSITIDSDLLKAGDMLEYEQVAVVNVTTGARFETYIIAGAAGTGVICLNGGAARLAQPGDLVILITYAQLSTEELATFKPTIVLVDGQNRLLQPALAGK
jgi:aspartate 1-decarboxylase